MAALDPSRGRSRGDGLVHEGVGPGDRTDAHGVGVSRTWSGTPVESALAMAAVEPLGSADPFDTAQWLVVRGTLRESDLVPLLEGAIADGGGSVTLDLCNLDVLTPGGAGRSATSPRNCGLEDACSRWCSRREVMWPRCSAPPAPSTTHAPSSRHRSPTENSGTGVMIERTCSRAPVRDGRGNPGAGGHSRWRALRGLGSEP